MSDRSGRGGVGGGVGDGGGGEGGGGQGGSGGYAEADSSPLDEVKQLKNLNAIITVSCYPSPRMHTEADLLIAILRKRSPHFGWITCFLASCKATRG